MAYRFRLETVLDYRRNLEEVAQQKLARELVALEGLVEHLAALEGDFSRLIQELEIRKQKLMRAPFYSLYMQAIDRKEGDIARQHRMIKAQNRVVERARAQLLEKVKSRQVMEKARERDQEKYFQVELKKEQDAGDEQMVLRFNRHGNGLPG